jgi:hypothetical protein
MHILDTDTLSRLHAGDMRVLNHKERYDPAEVVTTVITRFVTTFRTSTMVCTPQLGSRPARLVWPRADVPIRRWAW